MLVQCSTCRRAYDDAEQWTICPHGPLWAAPDAYCRVHDLVNCPLEHDSPQANAEAVRRRSLTVDLTPSSWIRADYAFYSRRATVPLAPDAILHDDDWCALFRSERPEPIAAALTRLLSRVDGGRYAGAVVIGLSFDMLTYCWQMVFLHPSLADVPLMERAPEVVLHITAADMRAAIDEEGTP